MVIEKRQLLGREKRDINETCHITTAPEMKSGGINATGCIYVKVAVILKHLCFFL